MSLDQFADFVVDYGGMGLIIIIFVVGVVFLYKSWPVLAKVIRVGSEIADLPETIAHLRGDISELSVTVKTIQKQVLPNGGSTLRDSVNRNEKQVSELTETVNKHYGNTPPKI